MRGCYGNMIVPFAFFQCRHTYRTTNDLIHCIYGAHPIRVYVNYGCRPSISNLQNGYIKNDLFALGNIQILCYLCEQTQKSDT